MANKVSNRLGSDLCMCRCSMCKAGLRTGWGGFTVKQVRRTARHALKVALKQERWDVVDGLQRLSVPYTD